MHTVLKHKKEENVGKMTFLSEGYILVFHKNISVPLLSKRSFFLREMPLSNKFIISILLPAMKTFSPTHTPTLIVIVFKDLQLDQFPHFNPFTLKMYIQRFMLSRQQFWIKISTLLIC